MSLSQLLEFAGAGVTKSSPAVLEGQQALFPFFLHHSFAWWLPWGGTKGSEPHIPACAREKKIRQEFIIIIIIITSLLLSSCWQCHMPVLSLSLLTQLWCNISEGFGVMSELLQLPKKPWEGARPVAGLGCGLWMGSHLCVQGCPVPGTLAPLL